jgi:hypothetical protein
MACEGGQTASREREREREREKSEKHGAYKSTTKISALHSHRADLGPYPGEGKTQDPSLKSLEREKNRKAKGAVLLTTLTFHCTR